MGFTKTKPVYASDGFAVWEGTVENGDNKGDKYLKIKFLGHTTNVFQVKEKGD
ncbi:hypothetical protein LCGC14_2025210 [marine sediment metagenome]|uniref:Uncharacterized protein n=1 Tax=marine sediment metagenome TaxID=412755 RepID=A0A0F9EWA1_9ZZZZ